MKLNIKPRLLLGILGLCVIACLAMYLNYDLIAGVISGGILTTVRDLAKVDNGG